MKSQSILTGLEFEDDDIKSFMREDVFVINIKQNAFEVGTDLSESAYVFELLEMAEKSAQAKIVFLYNSPGCFGEEAYDTFLRKIFKTEDNNSIHSINKIEDHTLRIRQVNILNHFIAMACSYKKILVMGLQGSVVTPFFGASLAADLRFASDDMEFSLAHLNYGLHPTGALPFLLPKHIGLSKSKDLLYRGGKISAREALSLNIVNKIFPKEKFFDLALQEISQIIKHDNSILCITKKLFHVKEDELMEYFEFETQKTVLK
jgi:enoyl-CoA hydratase/carnithine racemase